MKQRHASKQAIRQRRRLRYAAALGLIALLLAAQIALAQTGGYSMDWWTIDGGGIGRSEGGSYTLRGSAGQADAGRLGGGAYTLAGGFWNGDGGAPSRIYLSMVVR